ncbi:MAG: hypothetical protein AAB424_03525 [Patescibacteria group bacterium]
MRKVFSRIITTVSAFVLLVQPVLVQAAFQPGRIIADQEFIDSKSMEIVDVQAFLQRRGGTLGTMQVTDFNGVIKPTSEAIVEVARLYGINPAVILVTLQKEMSLLTWKTPTQRAYDYAMGYGCPDSGGCSGKAAGLYRQLDFATWQFRQYLDFPGSYTFRAGNTYTIDATTVLLENQATAALYNYTPHFHGNENFYNLYTQWFTRTFPDGSLVRIGKTGTTWYIQHGERRAILTRAAFLTRFGDYKKILDISPDALANYPRGTDIRLPNFSLVQTPDGTTYLLSGDEKRVIQSPEVFRNLGFNPEEVEQVLTEDIVGYLNGVTISNANAYPAGALVRIKENGGVAWIEQGIRYPILDRSILKSRFPNRKVNLTITNAEFVQYPRAEPLTLRDGELIRIKGEGLVSVISNGQRRSIPTRKLFNQYGYNMKNVITISPRVAELHPIGEQLPSIGK